MDSTLRRIIHIDMDCFYAAVEMLDRPDLRHRPMAVGGRPEGRGVITTANYEARKFGVRSALSCREAIRRCPDLVILPTRFQKYREISGLIKNIYFQYTPLVEPLSLDEAYLDVSDSPQLNGSATLLAEQIRRDIFKETGLTASAGIAPNKFLAKVASDWKKPNGQYTIAPQSVSEFIKTLPLKKIPGVGQATLSKMTQMGLETCLDLQGLSIGELTHSFGSFGERLFDLCRGIDHSRVKPERDRKSISVETTLFSDIATWDDLKKEVEKLFEELQIRMSKAKIEESSLKSLVVKLKTSDFQIHTKERALNFTQDSFLHIAEEHFYETGESIRLVGIGCRLDKKTQRKHRQQLALF